MGDLRKLSEWFWTIRNSQVGQFALNSHWQGQGGIEPSL